MKFLSDENLPRSILQFLRKKGFDVKDIQEEGLREVSNGEIGQLAEKEGRVVVTFDRDFLIPTDEKLRFSVIVLHFPKRLPESVIPYFDLLLKKIEQGRIKFPFIVLLSQERIEVLK